ncbi:MAG: flagellar biosynthesis anti-sigma factor FlgM [Desulfobacteraceae bacterium]|nr:flagellar biosynthesis anti-sigma factor FlgM [Desulfobacteraceae bacterium]
MKISNSTPNYINQTYGNAANNAANQNPKLEKPVEEGLTDSINLSDKTRDLQKISQALETEPANRAELVANLKQSVESNQYTVDAGKVAEKIVGTIMDDVV